MDIDFRMDVSPMETQFIHHGQRSHSDEDESDVVRWKSSQTSNYALDSLMHEAETAAHRTNSMWAWSSPGASTSASACVPEAPFFGPSDSPAPPQPPATRRRPSRPSHPPRTPSFSMAGLGTPTATDPAQFMVLLKGVSERANENAGMRSAGAGGVLSSAARIRCGVKKRTMSVRRERDRPSSVLGVTKSKGKARELSRDSIMSGTSSTNTSPSVSSPFSKASFSSGDTSMTSPEPDDMKRRPQDDMKQRTQDLMPPPPVPRRLPALDVLTLRLGQPQPATPVYIKPPPEQRTHPPAQQTFKPRPALAAYPDPPPRTVHPEPPRAAHSNPTPQPGSQLAPARKPAPTSEPRMHPLLQQRAAVAPPARANPPPLGRANAPPHANSATRAQPPTTQSQPQKRSGPPVLGMRRTNTAPLVASRTTSMASSSRTSTNSVASSSRTTTASVAPSSQRRFRPPLLNPQAAAGASTAIKTEVPVKTEVAPIVKSEATVVVKNEAAAVVKTEPPVVKDVPANGERPAAEKEKGKEVARTRDNDKRGSSPSDAESSYEVGDSSYDLEELEIVLRGYD
ncbi:hypothetical protein B0H10DRAFT_1986522 [Mycena sp. CBHHK59/15]|nr:hypothetical protein B0H10DRAFT_1986522 [Mycena sp. CBHHK59/15]